MVSSLDCRLKPTSAVAVRIYSETRDPFELLSSCRLDMTFNQLFLAGGQLGHFGYLSFQHARFFFFEMARRGSHTGGLMK